MTWKKSTQPLHEITRYSVESFLQVPDGYWGRISQGLALNGPEFHPSDAERATLWLAQKFDVEMAGAIAWHPAEFNNEESELRVTEGQVDGIRNVRDRLFRQWFELLPGELLALPWPDARRS